MATISQSGPVAIDNAVLDLSVLLTLPLTGHFSDSLAWNNSAGTSALIFGAGIVPVVSGNVLTGITAGTFTQVEVVSGGQTFDIAGMDVAASKFFDLIQAGQWAALARLAFSSDDTIIGTNLNDTLMGWGGNDFLEPGQGHDSINGGKGNDTIFSVFGHETVTGGGGADTLFLANAQPGSGVPKIRDFHHGVDLFKADKFDFVHIGGPGVLAADRFHLGTAATTATQGIIYDGATGRLWSDADGSGPAAQVEFAHLAAGTVLDASDFLIY